MPTNIEILKSVEEYTRNLQKGELPVWIAPLFDQPSPDYDTPEESAFDAALQELDNQNLDPNNPSASLSATLGAAKNHNVNPNQVVSRSQFRGALRDIGKNVSLAIAIGIKTDPERDKREQNTRAALSTLTPEVIGLAQAAKPEPNFESMPDVGYDKDADTLDSMFGDQSYDTSDTDTDDEDEGNQGAEAGTSSTGVATGPAGSDDTAAQWGGYDGSDQGGGTGDTGGLGDVGTEGFGADTAAAGLNTGGRIGALIQHLQTGGDVENAETDLGNANVPMGVVDDPDGAPSPFSGGTGVEDDLDMDVEAGSYVLNAEAVQLIGISDINAVIRDAYSIAAALGKPMPQDYDPQNKVPIRISNGEAVIPKALVDIIGLDKLEKWNKKGLELRKQKEEFMAQQQQAQPPQQQQVAAEAPMQQQMGQLMNQGGQPYKIQHIKGLPLKIFNRHLDRLSTTDPSFKDPKVRQEALENFDKYTNEVLKIESDKNWTVKNKYGYRGGFQFGDNDVDMTLNRFEREAKKANMKYNNKWVKAARQHKDASRLTPEQQTALFVTNILDKTLLDDTGQKLIGEGDKLVKGIFKNDKSSMVEAYERLHYADTERLKGLKGIPTRFRSNVILRFGDDWENKIFDFAKGIKEIFD